MFLVGFLEKNRDTFSGDLIQLIQASKFKFLTALFKDDFSMVSCNYCKTSDRSHTKSQNLKWFSFCLVVVFTQSIEARC